MKPRDEVKRKLVGQWLAKAEQDLDAAEMLRSGEPPLLYPACFHAQQAGEKYLKALLTWHQIEFPKTHSLGELLDLLKQKDAELASSLRDAVILNPYGVNIRYPGDAPEPSRKEAEEARVIVLKIRDGVLRRLQ